MISLLAVLTSAIAYVAIFPPYDASALAFVALAPLAWVLRDQTAARAALWAGLFGGVATAGIVLWLVPTSRDYFGLSEAAAIAFLLVVATFSAAPQIALAFGLLGARRHRSPAAWPILFALAWVASEWLRVESGLESPWGRLGDSQHAAPRLRQLADLCGVYGVSFLLALGSALAAEIARVVWSRSREDGREVERDPMIPARVGLRREWTTLGPASILFTLLFMGALAYGEIQSDRWARVEDSLDVVLVQGSVPQEFRWSRTRASQVLRRYVRLTREALRETGPEHRPELIVWPENAIQTSLDHPTYGPTTRRLATDVGVPLLIGAPRSETVDGVTRDYNSALFLGPDGSVEHYDKRKLLLFSERAALPVGGSAASGPAYSRGQRPGVFLLSGRIVSTLICMEALYPSLAREAARKGAAVIVNLSNDGWFRGVGASQQHLAQVRFRAIETRLPLLRATTSGITAVIGPDGAIDARLDQGEEGWLRTRVRVRAIEPWASAPSQTLYTRTGDLLPVVALVTCLAFALPWARLGRPGR